MKIDSYRNALCSNRAAELDLDGFLRSTESTEVATLIARFRDGDNNAKRRLPAVTYMGKTRSGKRRADDMEPTGSSCSTLTTLTTSSTTSSNVACNRTSSTT